MHVEARNSLYVWIEEKEIYDSNIYTFAIPFNFGYIQCIIPNWPHSYSSLYLFNYYSIFIKYVEWWYVPKLSIKLIYISRLSLICSLIHIIATCMFQPPLFNYHT